MRYLEIITIGLPFCAFKMICGLYLSFPLLTILGGIDILINLTNFITLLFLKRTFLDACFLSFIVRTFKRPALDQKSTWQDLGNSLDVLLSFSLVAYIIGSGDIKKFSPSLSQVWNISVILNVLGAGSSRMANSIKNIKNFTFIKKL
jgi:hypothetical protein